MSYEPCARVLLPWWLQRMTFESKAGQGLNIDVPPNSFSIETRTIPKIVPQIFFWGSFNQSSPVSLERYVEVPVIANMAP